VFGVSWDEPNAKIKSTIEGKPLDKTDKKPDTFTSALTKRRLK
jgi:hypothetical protein